MASVGEILAAERRRQGKSVHEVVEGTKIRSRMIDALENDRWEQLPSTAYVKGYIQSYARFLEIPSEPLLEQYRLEASSHEPRPTGAERYLNIPHETLVPEREKQNAIPPNVLVITGVAMVFVLLLACTIARMFPGGSGSPMPTSSDGGTAEASATTTDVKGWYTLTVSVRQGEASRVVIVIDNKQAFDDSLQGTGSREWRVYDRAMLKLSRPQSVIVKRDGKIVESREEMDLPLSSNE